MLRRHHEISAVSKDDFFAAFRMVAGGEGTITPEQVKDVLYEAMGAPPHDGPEVSELRGGECMTVKLCQADVEPAAPQLDEFLRGFEGMEKLDMETFEDVLDEYNTKHVTRPAKQYVSIQKLKDDRLKHRRCEGLSSLSPVSVHTHSALGERRVFTCCGCFDASKSLKGDSLPQAQRTRRCTRPSPRRWSSAGDTVSASVATSCACDFLSRLAFSLVLCVCWMTH